MDNRKKLLLLMNFWSIYRKKTIYFKRRRLLKLMVFIKWHLIQSNFMGQISFQQPSILLLENIPHKKRRYGMTEYNQSWFENFGVQRYEVLIYEIWQKELKIGPQTFKYLLNMIFPGIEKMAFFNWDCLSFCRNLSNSLIGFLFVSQF